MPTKDQNESCSCTSDAYMRDTGAFAGNANKRMKIDGNSLINNVINTHIHTHTRPNTKLVQINNLVKPKRRRKKTHTKNPSGLEADGEWTKRKELSEREGDTET